MSENKVITIFSTLSNRLIAECLIKILENKIMSGEIGVYPRILEVRKSTTEIEVDLELIEAKRIMSRILVKMKYKGSFPGRNN